MFKRGVSPVIATVLLIVVTLVAVSLVALFVIPFVNKNLDGSKDCFNVLNDIKLTDVGYTCSNVSVESRTGFSVQISNNNIAGFKAILFREGVANSYTISNNTKLGNIAMLGKQFDEDLEVPLKGGVRTYVADGEYNKVEVNPMLIDGTVCDAKEAIEIAPCFDSEIIAELQKTLK